MPNQSLAANTQISPKAQNYLNYYGLRSDPFSDETNFLFITPQIKKTLRLFDHLVGFSQKLILLTGTEGLGKTKVLDQFLKQRGQQDKLCYMVALKLDTPNQVLREISDEYGVTVAESATTEEISAGLDHFLQEVAEDGENCLLVLDDAHLFELSVLQVLAELALRHPGAINLILCGESVLHDKLCSMPLVHQNSQLIYHHPLSPFTLKDCKQYIQELFEQHGEQADELFADSDFLRIYQQSQGFPRQVIKNAQKTLEQGVERLLRSRRSNRLKLVYGGTLAAAVLAVSVLFWDGDEMPEAVADVEPEQPVVTLRRIERQAPIQANMGTGFTGGRSGMTLSGMPGGAVALTETGSQGFQTEPQQELIDTQTSFSLTEKSEVGVEKESLVIEHAAPSEESSVVTETVTLAAIATPNKKTEIAGGSDRERVQESSENELFTGNEKAILEFNENDYTVQLLGSRHEKSILTVLEGLESDERYRYFRTEHQGGPWFVLIYGNFPGREQAAAAAAGLPDKLRPKSAWIRQVSGIQKSLVSRNQ